MKCKLDPVTPCLNSSLQGPLGSRPSQLGACRTGPVSSQPLPPCLPLSSSHAVWKGLSSFSPWLFLLHVPVAPLAVHLGVTFSKEASPSPSLSCSHLTLSLCVRRICPVCLFVSYPFPCPGWRAGTHLSGHATVRERPARPDMRSTQQVC